MKHGVTERGVTETVVEVRDVNGRSGHAELTELTVTSSRGLTYRRPMSSAGSEATATATMTTATSGTAIESTRVRALVRAQALRRLREITEDLTRLDEWGRSEDFRWVRSDLRQIGEPETVERLVPLEWSATEPRRAVSSSLVALGRVEDAHESPGREPSTREPDSASLTAGRSDEDAREVRG